MFYSRCHLNYFFNRWNSSKYHFIFVHPCYEVSESRVEMLLPYDCCYYSNFIFIFLCLMRTYHIYCQNTHLSTIYMSLLVFTLSDGSHGTCLGLCCRQSDRRSCSDSTLDRVALLWWDMPTVIILHERQLWIHIKHVLIIGEESSSFVTIKWCEMRSNTRALFYLLSRLNGIVWLVMY